MQKPAKTVTFLLALWLIPLLLWGGVMVVSSLLEKSATSHAEGLFTTVGSRTIDKRIAVDIRVQFGPSMSLRVADQGMVTAQHMRDQTAPQTGDVAFVVDGFPKMFYRGDVPLYRELQLGDQGGDVRTLHELLRETGHLDAEDNETDIFSWHTQQAVRGFQDAVGLELTGVVHPDDFIYVPDSLMLIDTVNIQVGAPVPGDGVIAVGFGEPVRGDILQEQTERPPVNFETGDELTLSAGDVAAPLESLHPQEEQLISLVALLEEWAADDLVEVSSEGNERVYYGTQVLLTTPVEIGSVPNTSIVVGDAGATCIVAVADDGQYDLVPVKVSNIPGEIGVAGIDIEQIGATVLRDPLQAGYSGDTCRS